MRAGENADGVPTRVPLLRGLTDMIARTMVTADALGA
jgi:hypothetical protein